MNESRPREGGPHDHGQAVASILPPSPDARRPQRNQPVRPSRTFAQSDSPQAVALVIAAILDGSPTPEERDLPLALQELARIRSGARRVREAGLAPGDEEALLGALAKRAVRAELHEWAEQAVLVEIAGADVEVVDHSITTAHERLRRATFDQCPICQGPVLSEHQLEDRKRRERWAAEDRERWEGAAR